MICGNELQEKHSTILGVELYAAWEVKKNPVSIEKYGLFEVQAETGAEPRL